MRIFLVLGLAMIFAGCGKIGNYEAALHFDGVYRSERIDDYYSYLRFYPDGTVIEVGSTGQPNDVGQWFAKEHDGVSIGKVKFEGKHILFSTASSSGTVDYDGELVGNQLRLRSYSHINERQSNNSYVFLRWQAERSASMDADKPRH